MDQDFRRDGVKIISVKEVMKQLGLTLNELASIAQEINASLLIIPKVPIRIGIRFPNNYRRGIFDRPGKNPLSLKFDKMDGFTIPASDIKKILFSLNWKSSKPLEVIWINDNNSLAIARTPYSLALTENSLTIKSDNFRLGDIDDKISAYKNQEFYFKKKGLLSTETTLDKCFLTGPDIQKINNKIIKNLLLKFNYFGDYEINKWSNSLIKDINSLYYHFFKITSKAPSPEKKATEENVRLWLKERWYNNKQLSKQSFIYAPKIILQTLNPKIKLNLLEVDYHDKCKHSKKDYYIQSKELPIKLRERNQSNATDILMLIDIAAERNKNKVAGYETKTRFKETLSYIGITTQTIQEAIFSIINTK